MAEAGRYLRVTRKTIARMIRAGRIPAVKVGRSYRFLKAELERFLAGRGGDRGVGPEKVAEARRKLLRLREGLYEGGSSTAADHDEIYGGE